MISARVAVTFAYETQPRRRCRTSCTRRNATGSGGDRHLQVLLRTPGQGGPHGDGALLDAERRNAAIPAGERRKSAGSATTFRRSVVGVGAPADCPWSSAPTRCCRSRRSRATGSTRAIWRARARTQPACRPRAPPGPCPRAERRNVAAAATKFRRSAAGTATFRRSGRGQLRPRAGIAATPADHARADGVVRPLVDQDERAGRAVRVVGSATTGRDTRSRTRPMSFSASSVRRPPAPRRATSSTSTSSSTTARTVSMCPCFRANVGRAAQRLARTSSTHRLRCRGRRSARRLDAAQHVAARATSRSSASFTVTESGGPVRRLQRPVERLAPPAPSLRTPDGQHHDLVARRAAPRRPPARRTRAARIRERGSPTAPGSAAGRRRGRPATSTVSRCSSSGGAAVPLGSRS